MNLSEPFFSVIIPVYNREGYIRKAISSVLVQKFKDWELIIIDDGSTDDTKSAVEEFSDTRISYFYQDNLERSAARNNGISKAKGKYICFLDSDDYYLDDHLQVLHKYILSNNSPVSFFYTGPLEKAGEILKKRPIYLDKNEHPARFIFFNFLLMNSVCIHRDILKKHRFLEHQTILEDINLWMRIVMEFPFIQIPEYTTVCVLHEDQSAKRFFKDADMKVINDYVANFNHIFSNTSADKHITTEEKTSFIKRRYISAAFAASWGNQKMTVIKLLIRIIKLSPGFLIDPVFYRIIREALSSYLKAR